MIPVNIVHPPTEWAHIYLAVHIFAKDTTWAAKMFRKLKSLSKFKKLIPVRVQTMDAQLEFEIDITGLGRDLFDLVTRTIGKLGG